MKLKPFTFEHLFYLTAILLGLSLRLGKLGAAPLTDTEAAWALQALAGGQGNTGQFLAPQPAYVSLTGWLFDLFGNTNFLARLWPALTGSLLVLLPLVIQSALNRSWRDLRAGQPAYIPLLSRQAALVLAFGLALAPGLVVVSRQAGSPMPALSLSLLAIGLFLGRRPGVMLDSCLAGILAGLALLSGPAAVHGLLVLGCTLAAFWLLKKNIPNQTDPGLPGDSRQPDLKWFGLSMAGAVILVSSSFLTNPPGLATWFETLPAYFRGWLGSPGIPALRLLAALLVYQPIAVIFGLLGGIREGFFSGEQNNRILSLTLLVWIVIGLGLALLNPARQASDLIWVLAPAWILAATQIGRVLPTGRINLTSALHAILFIVLMGLLWYSLASFSRFQVGDAERTARLFIIVGILALTALTSILIQLGWSWEVARRGISWGSLGALGLFSISMLWGAAYLRPNQPQELWSLTPGSGEADLMLSTLKDLSSWSTGRPETIDILTEVDLPSLHWALRNFKQVRVIAPGSSSTLPATQLPSILITNLRQETPALTASYRGQDFSWRRSPGWTGALPADWSSWLTFRRASIQSENIILWARSDLFPGGSLELPSNSQNPPEDAVPYPELLEQP
ncbi:MAG: hypothetical protein MUE67_04055 [Anaerolineales bacterium]|jgi:hypothetical protein|nr:hypothetical protein [Anaerolineales bacterium]